jgi:hypothetical protein
VGKHTGSKVQAVLGVGLEDPMAGRRTRLAGGIVGSSGCVEFVIGDDESFYFTITICEVLQVGKSFFAVGLQKPGTKDVMDLTSFRIEC